MNINRKGFTLIELLIGITALVLITSAVYSSLRAGLNTYKRIKNESLVNQNTRQAWRMLSRDLRCAYASNSNTDIKFTGRHIDDNGIIKDIVTFTTYLYDNKMNNSKLSEVSYYIDNSPNTPQEGLVRAISEINALSAKPEPIVQSVTPMAYSLKLLYYDGLSWKDIWGIDKNGNVSPNVNSLPFAVEIQVKLKDKDGSENTVATRVPVMSN